MKYLAVMNNEPLKELCQKMVMLYGSIEKTDQAEKVIHLMLEMLRRKNQVTAIKKDALASWVEVLITAAYLHNLFYDGTLTSLFKVREIGAPIAKECGVPTNAVAAICQAVESQLGERTPVESCIPNDSTPNGIFSWAVWFIEEYMGTKPLPNCVSYDVHVKEDDEIQ